VNAITFEFDAQDEESDELARSLARWLNDDETLAGAARLRVVPPGPGEQGGMADATEVLNVARPLLDALVSGLFVWLTQRIRSRRVKLKVTRPDGTHYEFQVADIDDAERLQRQLVQFLAEAGATPAVAPAPDRGAGADHPEGGPS
jgi:hypothetical protein